jgi:hypothetical protein
MRERSRSSKALAAGDVGNAGRRIGLEAGMHVGDRGQPLLAELSLEHRPRELRLALMEVGAVRRVGDALSGPKRLEQRVERLHTSGDELCDRRDEVEARLVKQRLVVPGRERIPPPSRLGRGIVDLEDPGRSLLLQPLPDVPLIRPCALGELGRRRVAVGQGAVEAEPAPEVDSEQIPRAERRLEEALDEGVTPVGRRRHRQKLVRSRSRARLRRPRRRRSACPWAR